MHWQATLNQRLHGMPQEALWLFAAVFLSALPHFLHEPAWISVLFCLLLAWRVFTPLHDARGKSPRFPILKTAVAVTMLLGIFVTYGTLTGRDAGVSLLVLLSAMKLIELRSERDYYIAVFIALLLILTQFLYSQTLLTAAYTGFAVVVAIATLVGFNDRNRRLSPPRRLRLAGRLLLQALPLALILFLFFPRAPGPLWGLPRDAHGGFSSLDDEMSPGALSRLSQSDAVAFRVNFDGPVPPRSKLYWRGPVLWFTDGFKWVPEPERRGPATVVPVGDPITYTVTLEPTQRHWLFSLEMPTVNPPHAYLTRDRQIRTSRRIQARRRYRLTSYLNYRLLGADQEDLQRALQLPPGKHPRAVALARSWRRQGLGDTAIVKRALDYFHNNDFYYTLSPPPLLNDPVDEFLFRTRKGFCEHYAAAFTVLMRAAGIPARIVLGYQGGRLNPVGDYLIVRQRDAHAWTEVWLGEDRGWVRVDPTAAVSPARVSTGIEGALSDSAVDVPLGLPANSYVREAWERLSDTWDAINNRWNQWVLGYDWDRQHLFFRHIGLGQVQYRQLLLGLTFVVIAFAAMLAWNLFRGPAGGGDEARRCYDRFRRRLTRCGIRARDWEGPLDFAARAGRRRRDLAADIDSITHTYVALRYAGEAGLLDKLRQEVKRFRPKRR
jgi:transglutaminase-like putative cysteine protease